MRGISGIVGPIGVQVAAFVTRVVDDATGGGNAGVRPEKGLDNIQNPLVNQVGDEALGFVYDLF